MRSGDFRVGFAGSRGGARLLFSLLACATAGVLGSAGPAAAEPPFPVCTFAPLIGPAAGGTEVRIASGGLLPVTSVKFGGVESQGFSVARDDELIVISPPHADGPVDITVTTPEGTSGPCDDGGYIPFRFVTPTGGTWRKGSRMGIARTNHTATRLVDGKVLIVGGNDSDGGIPGAAELYDPSTRVWRVTGELSAPRTNHTATLLADGRVLVAGGFGLTGVDPDTGEGIFGGLSSAEVYDPATGMWTPTANSMSEARLDSHTATRLDNGKVLVVGGRSPIGVRRPLAPTDLYDPATNMWSSCPPPATPSAGCPGNLRLARRSHSATLLKDGKVLVAQGKTPSVNPASPVQFPTATTELYDPATGIWSSCDDATTSPTCPGPLTGSRFQAQSVTLDDGKALVIGGQRVDGVRIGNVDEYDPATGRWAATDSLGGPRFLHATTLLANGKVLVTGGGGPDSQGSPQTAAEIYDPVTRHWKFTDFQIFPRVSHTATLLANGQVLVAGGGAAQSELFTPAVPAGSLAPPPRSYVLPAATPGFPACPATAANVIRGTAAQNAILGSPRADRIFAGGGGDLVDGLAGDDCIDLGEGEDRGDGGSGADLMLGEAGRDRLSGDSGNDRLRGGRDGDRVAGGTGGDRLSGDQGGDRIDGGSGRDRINGGSGRDRISGGSGADRISGGSGGDRISARDGRRDRVACGGGRDVARVDRVDRVARDCERVLGAR